MKILKAQQKNLSQIVTTLKEKGVVVFPTDTIYGLLADATSKKAVAKIFKIKKRTKNKPLPVFVENIRKAKGLSLINRKTEEFLKEVWPGKVTVVLKTTENARKNLAKGVIGKNNKIGLRIPSYELIALLLKKLNFPLIGTSANISGNPGSIKVKEVLKQFENQKNKPDLVVNAEDLRKSKPSTVVDLTTKKPRILREGAIKIR